MYFHFESARKRASPSESERYPCLSEVINESQIPEFDNLYLDMNGIIHNCSHPNDDDVTFRITEEEIFANIFAYIECAGEHKSDEQEGEESDKTKNKNNEVKNEETNKVEMSAADKVPNDKKKGTKRKFDECRKQTIPKYVPSRMKKTPIVLIISCKGPRTSLFESHLDVIASATYQSANFRLEMEGNYRLISTVTTSTFQSLPDHIKADAQAVAFITAIRDHNSVHHVAHEREQILAYHQSERTPNSARLVSTQTMMDDTLDANWLWNFAIRGLSTCWNIQNAQFDFGDKNSCKTAMKTFLLAKKFG